MEADLVALLLADPSLPNQQIRNAAAALEQKYGFPVPFTAVQSKRWYLAERGALAGQKTAYETDGDVWDGSTLPVYNEALRLPPMRGWLEMGDLHAPFIKWTVFAEAIERALDMGVRDTVIVGDYYDMHALGIFPNLVPAPSFDAETRAAEHGLEMLDRWMRRIVFTTGNHDARLLKHLGGLLPGKKAGQMFLDLMGGNRGGKAIWSTYGWCVVDSPTGPWRLTHQRNYSRIRARVAVQLAAKYRSHIVTFHEHGIGKLPSDCGLYTCVASGCMADWDKMAYINLVDTTAPVWQNGYVILDREGTAHLFGGPQGFASPYTRSEGP